MAGAAESVVIKKVPMLTRGLRVEVVKPLNASWDEVGPLLRTQRSVMHRLYTASALAAIEADRQSRKGVTGTHPQTAAYRAVDEELEDIRDWAAGKLKKRGAKDSSGTLARLAGMVLPGGTRAGISAVAWAHVGKWKKDKSKTRVPTWKYGAPIPCRAQESGLRLDEDGRAVLEVKIAPKGRHEFAVRAGKGAHWARLRALASGADGLKRGDVKLSYDVRQKKWFAIIAYSEPKPRPPERLDPDHVMVLHRGQRNLLMAMTTRRQTWNVIAKGDKLREFKRRMRKRREQVQGVPLAERGTGSRGRGRRRRYAVPEALAEMEARYVHTLCQQIGARVATLAKEWGCGTVLIEDYGGIGPDGERGKRQYLERFPNHELAKCIEWSLAKIGVELGTYEHAYVSQTCPRCGNVDAAQHNQRTGVFHCRRCSLDRQVDWVSGVHALRRANGDAGAIESQLKAEDGLAHAIQKGELE